MTTLKDIAIEIAKAKSQRDIDRINGYIKAVYDYDRITYDELQQTKRLLNERHAELVK